MKAVIIGAGPAGLTAAYQLCQHHIPSIVLDRHPIVGGHARTEEFKGFHFDIGGHRFFTKVEPVNQMWQQVLRESFLTVPRLSRIYYRGKFFYYPLRLLNVLIGLGPVESVLILLSYLRARLRPQGDEKNLEQWLTNRFGDRLYRAFFKGYTEKVWGRACAEIGADWAAQRIKGLSLISAVWHAISRSSQRNVKTLIEEFKYPELGPGMMWEAVRRIVEARGSEVRLGADVVQIRRTSNHVNSVSVRCGSREEVISGTHFISSMPLRLLMEQFSPPPPDEVLEAARNLHHRDFLMVGLLVNQKDLFPDNWIYVHNDDVRAARIQNFKNWSSRMVPDSNKTSLGVEYFCTVGDEIWSMPDRDLIELAKREVEIIGLTRQVDVEGGTVIREPQAYPVYDSNYRKNLDTIKTFLSAFDNLQTVGRNGLHRYNNQDHAMLTAMLAVKNILGGSHDLWSVNTEEEYHEEIRDDASPARRAFRHTAGS